MAYLKRTDPGLWDYMMKHRIPEVLQSIFTALVVNQPKSLPKFVIEKIDELENDPSLWIDLQWDTFIYEHKKPRKPLGADLLDFLWSYEEISTRPTVEQNSVAFYFYYSSLVNKCFKALKDFWMRKKRKRYNYELKLKIAKDHYRRTTKRKILRALHIYVSAEKVKREYLAAAVQKIVTVTVSKIIFKSWRTIALDSKREDKYFKNLEREKGGGGDKAENLYDRVTALPRKLATQIFSYLDLPDLITCSKVCRSWKVMTQNNFLWSKLNLTKIKDKFSNNFMANLIHKCRSFLCHLNLRGVHRISTKCLSTISECRNLQDLNISDCNQVTDEIVKQIALGCSGLLYLNLSRTRISDAALKSISRHCGNIQFLNMAHCFNITERGLQYIANGRGSAKLLYLDLSGCEQIGVHGFGFISNGCSRLSTLVINQLPLLGDDPIKAFMSECNTLHTFTCLNSPHLSDAAYLTVMACKQLTTIKIEGNNRITDASIKVLAKSCPGLRLVYMVNCVRLTDLSLKALSQCKCLIVLNMADCYRLSDVGVRHLVEGASADKLRELNLTNCVRISDVSILRLMQKCRTLTYANFSYCEPITDAGLELFGTMPNLISIDISGCNASDAGIGSLGNNQIIKDISMSDCIHVSDLGLMKLFPNTKDLENLDLSYCKRITDQSIKTLAFHCRKLRRLNIAGCSGLTDLSIQYVSGGCPYLQHLDISGCKSLSDKSMRFIRKGCKHLKVLQMCLCIGVTRAMGAKMRNLFPYVIHTQDDSTPSIHFHAKTREKVIVNY